MVPDSVLWTWDAELVQMSHEFLPGGWEVHCQSQDSGPGLILGGRWPWGVLPDGLLPCPEGPNLTPNLGLLRKAQ